MFGRYQALAPDVVPYDMSGKEGHTVRIPVTLVENMPELKVIHYSSLKNVLNKLHKNEC